MNTPCQCLLIFITELWIYTQLLSLYLPHPPPPTPQDKNIKSISAYLKWNIRLQVNSTSCYSTQQLNNAAARLHATCTHNKTDLMSYKTTSHRPASCVGT